MGEADLEMVLVTVLEKISNLSTICFTKMQRADFFVQQPQVMQRYLTIRFGITAIMP
jgi:hypothetical protein